MANKYVRQASSVADEWTGDAAGIGVNTSTGLMQWNPDGTKRTGVEATASQTLTNKTLTSPTITSAVVTDAVEVVTATNVIAATETGKTFILNAAAGFASTLPAPAAGLNFTFIIGTTVPTSTGHTIVTTSGANVIYGNVATVPVDDAGIRLAAQDTLTFVHNVALAGDYITVTCDGTNWHVGGVVNVVEALTSAAS